MLFFRKPNIERLKEKGEVEKLIKALGHQKDPDMRGIAEGSGNNFGDIVALNARTELFGKSKDKLDGCTAFGVSGEATQNNESYIGQNWDFYTKLKE